jgi:PKD repeat protein
VRTVLAAVLTAALAVPATASAAEYYVSPGGLGTTGTGCAQGAPCPNIHAAVLASETSNAADTIHVDSGTYSAADDAAFIGTSDSNLTVVGAGDSTVINASSGAIGVRVVAGASVTVRNVFVQAPVNAATQAVYVGPQSTLHLDHVNVAVQSSAGGLTDHAIEVGLLATATLDFVNATVNGLARGQALQSDGTATVRNSTLTQNNTDISSGAVRSFGGDLTVRESVLTLNSATANNSAVLAQTMSASRPISLRFDDDIIIGGATTLTTAAQHTASPITLVLNNDTVVPASTASALVADLSTVAANVNLGLNSNILRATLPFNANVINSNCLYNDFPVGVTPGYACTNTTNSDASALFGAGYDLATGSPAIDSGDPAAIAGEPVLDAGGRPRLSRSDGGCGPGRRDRGAYEFQGAGTPPALSLAGPDTALTGQAVTFTPTTVGAPAYAWSFGDGATSAVAGPATHAYAAAGTFVVSLTVNAGNGCTTTRTRSVSVTSAAPPPDTKKPVLTVKKPKKVKKRKVVKLKITLSEAAKISGKACRKVGKTTKCVSFTTSGKPGSQTLSVLKGKLKKAGSYTLTLTATDAAKNVSSKVKVKLTVKR